MKSQQTFILNPQVLSSCASKSVPGPVLNHNDSLYVFTPALFMINFIIKRILSSGGRNGIAGV